MGRIELVHEALPDFNFSDITLETKILDQNRPTPFLISSMTAGHRDSTKLNELLAQLSAERGWLMGVGSQRRELTDPQVKSEWQRIRQAAPNAKLLGNLGIAQLIQTPTAEILKLVENLNALAMIIHTNPLQECLQPEGTPQFAGAHQALERLCRELPVPVILKETGCGFSLKTLKQLHSIGLAAVDVSGFGGTHWGRVEGDRSQDHSLQQQAAQTFKDWGIATLDSVLNAIEANTPVEVWASGGVRSGLDAAKLLALGAQCVGLAKPILANAVQGESALRRSMEIIEYELKVALFCSGIKKIEQLKHNRIWQWRKIF